MKSSVALCTYNGEKYLAHQLESIFQQSHPLDEIVVCDDGSSDGTLSILEAFQLQHPHTLMIHRNEQNLGGRKNFEKCFDLCTGDVIFFCDQDDIWHSDKVQKTLTWFEEEKNCWAIASDAQLIDENGEDLQRGFWESFVFSPRDLEKMPARGLFEFVLRHHNVIAGAMLAVKKEAKQYIYPFKLPSGIWHDEWITIILSCIGKMKLIEEKLVKYRLHSEQQAGVGKDSADLAAWTKKLKNEDKLRADPEFYLSHAWSTYRKSQQLHDIFPCVEFETLEKSLHLRLQNAKQTFFKGQGFFLRKARLFKWYIDRRYVTSWKDVISI